MIIRSCIPTFREGPPVPDLCDSSTTARPFEPTYVGRWGLAIRLDDWLRGEALASGGDRVPVKRIYQYGPNCVRDSRDFRAALALLAERGRARMKEDGRRRSVAINPALLNGLA
jgi:hypothetical protein